jgi:hypothetical protein
MSEFNDGFELESVHQSNKAEDPLFAHSGNRGFKLQRPLHALGLSVERKIVFNMICSSSLVCVVIHHINQILKR